jgi:hypothetical protein
MRYSLPAIAWAKSASRVIEPRKSSLEVTIKMSSQEPPTYSQLPDTQLLIVPSSNSIQFQNGFLGVDDANSVEGEVHVKGALPGDWSRLSVRISRMTNK